MKHFALRTWYVDMCPNNVCEQIFARFIHLNLEEKKRRKKSNLFESRMRAYIAATANRRLATFYWCIDGI